MVIVGSILLALALDAWWDGVQEREEEHQALEALAGDFTAAADGIGHTLLTIDSMSVAINVVLGWTGPAADSRNADSLALLLPTITRLPGFRPPLGTLEALLGSGNLRLIQNETLRAALASFPSRLAGMQRTEDFGAQGQFGDFLPYLNRSIPMRRFGRAGDDLTRFESDVSGLLRSLEFENQLQGRLTNVTYLEEAARNMWELISSIREMLEAELRM
ncbi:MAG: hypothetical protein O2958_11395 [Gemmatimonadetes bacterium]|nr:hypothetical protein [Gemmatimonadota bacterium]MDA1104847.1 hypothetical protein [Gemmatimonadota bacterium]